MTNLHDARVEAAVDAAWVKSMRFRGVGGQTEFAPPWEFQEVVRTALAAADAVVTVDEAALIREAKAEARGEALIDAVQAHRKLHETYGSTSVCHGGIGGQVMTPHCAEICDNINAHLTEISAWDALELEAVEFSRARAAEYRKGARHE
jgi:hypothetical protein